MIVSDSYIDELLDFADSASDDISGKLADLISTEDGEERRRLFFLIAQLIDDYKTEFRSLLSAISFGLVAGILGEMSSLIGEDISVDDIDLDTVGIESLLDEFADTIDGAFDEISNLLNAANIGAETFPEGSHSEIASALAGRLVGIIGSDAKIYGFSLREYVDLVGEKTFFGIMSLVAVGLASYAGTGLVRVSTNPSTVGDYCDEYIGKVFSVSGAHPNYPPVESLPGGGCPMHPRCHHYLLPYTGGAHGGSVDQDFLDLSGNEGMRPWDYEKLWRSKHA